jgi:hypothetical protein
VLVCFFSFSAFVIFLFKFGQTCCKIVLFFFRAKIWFWSCNFCCAYIVLLRFATPPDCSGVAASRFLDAAAARGSSPRWLQKIQKGFLSRI